MSPISYQLVRSNRRKSISLQVKQGQVRVLAPHFVELSYIEQLLRDKQPWLEQKLALFKLQPQPEQRLFENDEVFYWLGEPLLLHCYRGKKNNVTVANERLLIECKSDAEQLASRQVQRLLHSWYKQQAQDYLAQRLDYWQQKTQLKAERLTVRYFKSRWGSCDSQKHVKLNWLLMMAPAWVIDYVIVHELCHLKLLNHSAAFWQLVHSFGVDHRGAKQWLAQHQQHLYWQH